MPRPHPWGSHSLSVKKEVKSWKAATHATCNSGSVHLWSHWGPGNRWSCEDDLDTPKTLSDFHRLRHFSHFSSHYEYYSILSSTVSLSVTLGILSGRKVGKCDLQAFNWSLLNPSELWSMITACHSTLVFGWNAWSETFKRPRGIFVLKILSKIWPFESSLQRSVQRRCSLSPFDKKLWQKVLYLTSSGKNVNE